MARRKSTPAVDDDFTEHILDVSVSDEIRESFLEYAYSVIYARALPDARDGLKPVQRRILYTMDEMRLFPDRSHVKCARVVGQVMGQLHPHGDSAIYDALVRTAQAWSMRLPLVDGHGNFGSPDAGPAAMRYTECRMAPAALAMTGDLDSDTVEFRPNYDGKATEPTVLPSAFPNLLVNGASGIAVGMATNMAPHNLVEVVQGLRHLLKHPKADLSTIMRFIPGPDLPTGGKIIGLDGIADAYATGRGAFKIRATTRIEQVSPRRKGIVVTELPYQVGTEKIIEQIKNLVSAKKIQGIADLKDLTDLANGTRLVIEVKNGFNPEALAEQLFKATKLEDSFSINAVALVDGQPRTLGLLELMQVYLDHRLDVVLRRSKFRRAKAADRLHLVEGLLIAILDIDDVIAIIRGSDDAASARARLIEVFDLTEAQANYILDMPLRRLTKYSTIELESERDELNATIEALDEIINDDARLRQVVGDELGEVAKKYGTPRRTVLLSSSGATATASAAAPLEVADDPCWVLLSTTGLVARTDSADALPASESRAAHDVIRSAIRTTARGDFGVLTNRGRLVKLNAVDLPTVPITAQAPNLAGGVQLSELVMVDNDEQVLGLCTLTGTGPGLALGTRRGVVKRVTPEVLGKDSWDVIRLDDGDEVVGALELAEDDVELVFVTTDAQLLHFPASVVRPQGRSGGGVAGIKLGAGAEVCFFGATPNSDAVVLTVAGSSDALPGTDAGSWKLTDFAEYPGKGRATAGVRCHRFLRGEDQVITAWVGPSPAIASATSGSPIDLGPVDGKRDGSGRAGSQPVGGVASGAARDDRAPDGS
ncbi:MAG TPA: DNA topoisomerase IV subunit A [Candidatus Avipropionibacterium avicola]|uniref:DNA topoisomerase (ATP-hydrolyzing) n=1 Tax=Candidatus Avipropionibacterium avicola TaxID=2840701 RepID=A0A9D1KKG9_9ACTN|nr:DNA topoisomerase IV subunit A [Candidatus Avipropionibacterium avicola]